MKKTLLLFLLLVFVRSLTFSQNQKLPEGFSYLKQIAPTIESELRYCRTNNFLGTSVSSYNEDVLITSTRAAEALLKVQTELEKKGLGLKVFDAYRPQSAVNHFVKWARKINDTIKKEEYYPEINKRHLFKFGYISSRSGHSRGSSVDLTLIELKTKKELDMGSPFDFFGDISHITYQDLTEQQKQNRQLLREVMSKFGFRPYKNEWWHFTLRNEPFPNTYFDFPIE